MNPKGLFLIFVVFLQSQCCHGKSHPKPSCSYPPSQWCRTLEIAVECGVQKQCMELAATRPDPSVPPVEVALYYEGFCPGSRAFLTQQLYPTWTMLKNIMNVTLVPFGNAREVEGQNSFECQHGVAECQVNTIETCVLHIMDSEALPIIHCMQSAADILGAAQPCVESHTSSLEWAAVESCAKGAMGHRLMHENALKTQMLVPSHTHVPWVTFNGVYSSHWEVQAMSSLFNLVCSLYKGGKPPVCTGVVKRLNRSFC